MPEISLKSERNIAVMAEGGEKLARIFTEVLKQVEPGTSTLEIDSGIEERIINAGGKPSFKMVPRYHWASCVGVNDEVVHSVPLKDKLIKEGDILKIDAGIYWKGFHTDAAWTVEVYSSGRQRFLEAGEKALREAIKLLKPGNRVGHISQMIQGVIEKYGFTPVTVLTGHGIGESLHEEPTVPCFLGGRIDDTLKLRPGMTLAIEIIYTLGEPELFSKDDGWTICTKDGKISALFEETVAVTETEPLVLTPLSLF